MTLHGVQRLHGIGRGNAASVQKHSRPLGILKECELHFIHMIKVLFRFVQNEGHSQDA